MSGAPTDPDAVAITIAVRAAGQTATVSYLPGVSPRPPELDHLLRGLEDRRSWQPAHPRHDPAEPPTRTPAPATVLERRPDAVPPYVPPTTEPRPTNSEAPPFGPDPPRLVPQRSEPARPLVASPAPPRRRGRLMAALAAVILVVTAGITAFILTKDDGRNSAASSAPSTPTAPGAGTTPEQSRPPSSAELGLPSGPALADNLLVANQDVAGTLDLYTIDSRTGQIVTRLTSDDSPADFPVISPDRSSVVYVSQRAESVELWVVATDGTGARPLFAETPPGCDSVRRPAWNPADPSMLAVVCMDAAGTATLQLLTPWGGGIRTLETGLPQFDDLAFSPDGRLLVYWANSDPAAGDGRLYTMPNDGSSPPVQLTDGALSGAADAIWSPDGTQIAFRAQVDDGTESNTEIFVMAADGADPRPLAPEVGIDQDPAWSPDGSMIAYKSDRADGTASVPTDCGS